MDLPGERPLPVAALAGNGVQPGAVAGCRLTAAGRTMIRVRLRVVPRCQGGGAAARWAYGPLLAAARDEEKGNGSVRRPVPHCGCLSSTARATPSSVVIALPRWKAASYAVLPSPRDAADTDCSCCFRIGRHPLAVCQLLAADPGRRRLPVPSPTLPRSD